jgi:hypothetical protein
MPEHRIGSREEWQAAREELARLEAEQARREEEIKTKRLDLPWVPVGTEYQFGTAEGTKTLAELFDGRSQVAPRGGRHRRRECGSARSGRPSAGICRPAPALDPDQSLIRG